MNEPMKRGQSCPLVMRQNGRRSRTGLSALPVLLLACFASAGIAQTNTPTLVIYVSPSLRPAATNTGPQIITAVWNDGRIVWSQSPVGGGAPYREGRFEPDKLASLLDTLEGRGTFTNASLARARVGPDSSSTIIAIDDGRRRLRMRSWHELFEQGTNLVVTSQGVEPLAGRNRQEVLEQQPEDYRRMRQTWSEIRQGVAALVPKAGEPFEGTIPIPRR